MEFEQIMNKIKLGLTGELEKDVIYIMEQTAEYKQSPFAEKISRETGKMIYDMLSDEEKDLFGKVLQEDGVDIKNKIEQIEKEIFECNYLKASEMAEKILSNIINDGITEENFDYVSLNSLFELCIYTEIYKKGRYVKPTPFNYSYLYRIYGFCLFKLSRDEDAEKAYENALFWNPVSVSAMLDLAELKYNKKQYKSFFELIKNCFNYSYDLSQIALCYYNLGRYYETKKDSDLAINMYILAHYFKHNKAALRKIETISRKKGMTVNPPSAEEMKKICDSIGIPIGVNPKIITLAANFAENAKKQGNLDASKYFYDILFSLTGDKMVMDKILDYVKKSNEGETKENKE